MTVVGIWVTRDGRRIPYFDLDNQHLLNILAKGAREPGWRADQVERLRRMALARFYQEGER